MVLGEILGVYKMFFKMLKFTLDLYTGPLYKFFWKNKNKKNAVFGRKCIFSWKNSDFVRESTFSASVQIRVQIGAQIVANSVWPFVARVHTLFTFLQNLHIFTTFFFHFYFLKNQKRTLSGIFATFYVLKKGSFFSKKKFRHEGKTSKKFPLVC